MKFLITTTPNDIALSLPVKKQAELIDQITKWYATHCESGKCKGAYAIPGSRKVVSIWEVDSLEELMAIGVQSPTEGLTSVELSPLLDLETAHSLVNKAFEKLAAE